MLRPFRPLTVLSEEEATVIRMAYKAQDKVGPTYLYAFIILSLLDSAIATLALTFLKYAKHVPTSGPLLFLCPLSGMLLTPLINISTPMTSSYHKNYSTRLYKRANPSTIHCLCPALYISQ